MNQSLPDVEPEMKGEAAFNHLLTPAMQALGYRHWTPLRVVKKALGFLTGDSKTRILDIGSGSGKFCLSAADMAPGYYFYGIEQRQYLFDEAQRVQTQMGLSNVTFGHGNFTQLDLRYFDHFYFFNSFYENIHEESRIDEQIDYSVSLYNYYVCYLRSGLQAMPIGTRIVTYHSLQKEIPLSYDLVDTRENGNLNFWIKRTNQ